MSRQKVQLDSWGMEKAHREKLLRKMQKRDGLRALIEMWEARDDADHAYILKLRAKLRQAENQLAAMSI